MDVCHYKILKNRFAFVMRWINIFLMNSLFCISVYTWHKTAVFYSLYRQVKDGVISGNTGAVYQTNTVLPQYAPNVGSPQYPPATAPQYPVKTVSDLHM